MVRAVRGATTVEENSRSQILEGVKELIKSILSVNSIESEDMISFIFTMTKDLDAVFPAAAVREMGIENIPLMCSNEIDVMGSLKRCIRVMLFFNTEKKINDIRHVYLRSAKSLRPDLTGDKYEKDQNSD